MERPQGAVEQVEKIYNNLSSKQMEIVRAINNQDLILLCDLGVLETNYSSDLNFPITDEGLTPLMLACSKGNVRLVQMILKSCNIRPNKTDQAQFTALHIAAQAGSVDVIKLLKEHNIYYQIASDGTTPLHEAVKNGHIDAVKFFIEEMNRDVNEAKDADTNKILPISFAIARGNLEMVQYLCSKGAKINAEMFYYSVRDAKVMQFVLEKLKSQGYTGDRVEKELVNGKFDHSLSTPLIRAAYLGNLEIVKYLIDHYGVHPSETNKNDENCLMAAVLGKSTEVVKFLCQNCLKPKGEIDINYECKRNGLTVFARACLQQTFSIAELLFKYGKADVNYINVAEGKTVLTIAAELKLPKCVQFLIQPEYNADDTNLMSKLGISKEVLLQRFNLRTSIKQNIQKMKLKAGPINKGQLMNSVDKNKDDETGQSNSDFKNNISVGEFSLDKSSIFGSQKKILNQGAGQMKLQTIQSLGSNQDQMNNKYPSSSVPNKVNPLASMEQQNKNISGFTSINVSVNKDHATPVKGDEDSFIQKKGNQDEVIYKKGASNKNQKNKK